MIFEITPGEAGSGIEFENDITGGAIPREYIPAVEKGVRASAEGGVLAGYPVTDVKVRLYDGSFHEVDSNEMAFRTAASMAFRNGIQKAGPILQEPVMKVEATTPPEFLSDVIGGLNAKRCTIDAIEPEEGFTVIRCYLPLAESFGYATDLRSATQGRATYSMEFEKYNEAPANIAEEVIKKAS